jgi:lysozyme family protein
MFNLKKYTRKDRYGNSITVELDTMQQPTVPSMDTIPHPGEPKGTDTVPAWLTPGEFVMNAEATRMYEPQIKAMNDHGRAVQRQQGGTIPEGEEDRFLNIEGGGGTNKYGTGYGGRATLNIPVTDNFMLSPYISGGGFKPNDGPHRGSIGQYGIGASYRFNKGGDVPPVTMPERGAYLPDWVKKYALEQEKKVVRKADGGWISNLFLSDDVKDAVSSAQAPNQYQQSRTAEILRNAPSAKPYMDPEGAREREIAAENARAGAEKIAPNIPVVGPMADYLIQRRKHYEQMDNILHKSSGGNVPPLDMMVDQVLQHEGGFADVTGDRGGRTNYGITQSTWGDRGDVKDITKDQARGFYENLYNQSRIDRFPEELRPQIFDMVVNHGYGNAMKIVQGAAGVDRDGKVGPATLKAVGNIGKGDLVDSRLDFYNSIVKNDPSQKKFLKGWTNRAVAYREDGSVEPEMHQSFPVPPNPELVPVLDNGLYAMDPSVDAYPPHYDAQNYIYNTQSDEIYDQKMEEALDRMSEESDRNQFEYDGAQVQPVPVVDKEPPKMPERLLPTVPEGTPDDVKAKVEDIARKRWEVEQENSIDEFSDIPRSGGVEPLTFEDQQKVEEGRVRRQEDYSDQLAKKLESGEELSETEKTTLAELQRSRSNEVTKPEVKPVEDKTKKELEEETAPLGDDISGAKDLEEAKIIQQYGQGSDEQFAEIDKQFSKITEQVPEEEQGSWVDNFVSKDMQKSIGGFFTNMMNHALSDRALSALVMNYVGSRLMGYDHGASFGFAAKKYGKQVEASQALEDKLYLSGKYKAPSIARAMERGDFGELELAKSGVTATTNFKDFYRAGKKYRAQEFKDANGNSVYYTYDPATKQRIPIDISFSQDPMYVPNTPEYKARMEKASNRLEKLYEAQESLVGIRSEKKDGVPTKYYVQRRPVNLASDYMAWAKKNGLEPDSPQAESIIGNAYAQAVEDIKDGKLKSISDITPYLDAQLIRESTNSNELFMVNRDKFESGDETPKYVRGDLMAGLYQKATATARNKGWTDMKSGRQAVFEHAVKRWGELSKTDPKAYKKYMESGSSKLGTTPFYNFMNDEFDKIMKSLANQQ